MVGSSSGGSSSSGGGEKCWCCCYRGEFWGGVVTFVGLPMVVGTARGGGRRAGDGGVTGIGHLHFGKSSE